MHSTCEAQILMKSLFQGGKLKLYCHERYEHEFVHIIVVPTIMISGYIHMQKMESEVVIFIIRRVDRE